MLVGDRPTNAPCDPVFVDGPSRLLIVDFFFGLAIVPEAAGESSGAGGRSVQSRPASPGPARRSTGYSACLLCVVEHGHVTMCRLRDGVRPIAID
jgi:hypothetical protein